MEFPEDILTVIRSFARPRMKFIHEYNEIVRFLGVEWPAVKVKLATRCRRSPNQIWALC